MGRGIRITVWTAALLLCAFGADAAPHRHYYGRALTDPDLDAALVIEARTGRVLFARNADAVRHPASLTKMMTLYLLFERLRAHTIGLDDSFAVSANAAMQPRSRVRLREGWTIPVETAIQAITVASANDAAVAVAEGLGGTEAHFAELMTAKARALGMAHTFFHNATGLPDDLQQSTAADLALLARHLVYDFPEYFAYFRLTQMSWRGEDYTTHNALLGNYEGADGIKTGYIDASGYNLVSTVERGGKRLIAVVLGGLTAEKRDEAMIALLDQTFDNLPPGADAAGNPFALAARAPAKPRAAPIPASASASVTDKAAFVAATMASPWAPLFWPLAVLAQAREAGLVD